MSLTDRIDAAASPTLLQHRSYSNKGHSYDNGNGSSSNSRSAGDDLSFKISSTLSSTLGTRLATNSNSHSLGGSGSFNNSKIHEKAHNNQNNHEHSNSSNVGLTVVEPGKNRFRWLALAGIFLTSILLLLWVYSTFPNLEPNEKELIKLPRNIEDAKELGSVLSRYKNKYYFEVLSGVLIVYIFLQTFAIPGSIFLSILSGFLFNFWVALPLVCFCSATGASFCYGLSWLVGRRLILKYFPEKVESWSTTVERHRDNLLNYILFLRVTPFLPNWFINITSPVLGVPIVPFFMGTFFGVAPPSFVAIQAGTTLNKLTSSSDAVSWTSLLILIVLGVLSLIPVLLKNRLKEKFDKAD